MNAVNFVGIESLLGRHSILCAVDERQSQNYVHKLFRLGDMTFQFDIPDTSDMSEDQSCMFKWSAELETFRENYSNLKLVDNIDAQFNEYVRIVDSVPKSITGQSAKSNDIHSECIYMVNSYSKVLLKVGFERDNSGVWKHVFDWYPERLTKQIDWSKLTEVTVGDRKVKLSVPARRKTLYSFSDPAEYARDLDKWSVSVV